MKRISTLFALLVVCMHGVAAAAPTLKVGIYDNAPKLYVDAGGKPAGILVEVLDQVARAEHWQLQYVHCEWQACLDSLARGEIDLLPDVAFSDERNAQYELHRTPALYSWSQVYRRPGVAIGSILDLKDKRIALLEGSIQQQYLANLLGSFGLNAQLIPARSMEQAFRLVDERRADAVVANQYFGDMQVVRNHLISTPVVFQPARLFYAAPKGRHRDVLAAIDRHLAAWQADPDSVYYRILGRWQAQGVRWAIPAPVWWTLAAAFGLLLVSLLAATWRRPGCGARWPCARASCASRKAGSRASSTASKASSTSRTCSTATST